MKLGMEVGLGPGHIVLDGDPALPPQRGTALPNFRLMSAVAKRSPISATAEHLSVLLQVGPTVILLIQSRPILKYSTAGLFRHCFATLGSNVFMSTSAVNNCYRTQSTAEGCVFGAVSLWFFICV